MGDLAGSYASEDLLKVKVKRAQYSQIFKSGKILVELISMSRDILLRIVEFNANL